MPIQLRISIRNFFVPFAIGLIGAMFCGCEKSPPPEFRLNSVELLKQEKLSLDEGEQFDANYIEEISNILTATFGTPDDPKFPFLVGEEDPAREVVSLENLQWAAGPVKSDKEGRPITGLYREHCAHCHGVSGDGAGPTAAFLNPYPRDFRMSMFKFKKTPLRQRPTDTDMTEIIRNGIPGTAMPSFRTLPPDQVKALIDYVKYLTIRGQFERFLMTEISSLDEGEPIIDLTNNIAANESSVEGESAKSATNDGDDEEMSDEDKQEYYDDRMAEVYGDGLIEGIVSRWLDTEDDITEVDEAPASMNVNHADHADLVEQGRVLFYTKGNCAQCHGETAYGDGQTSTFDEWTKDWKSKGVDFFDKSTYRDFLAAGAMPPRPIRPRNLRIPVYRGGGHLDDIYLRVANGIEGTPMPSGAALSTEETWAIVAYVKSLPFENSTATEPKPVNDQAIAK